MKASILIKYLENAGWEQVRLQGTHRILSNPKHHNLLSIPDLGEESLQGNLVNDICREAGLKGRVHKIKFSPKGVVMMIKNVLGISRD